MQTKTTEVDLYFNDFISNFSSKCTRGKVYKLYHPLQITTNLKTTTHSIKRQRFQIEEKNLS